MAMQVLPLKVLVSKEVLLSRMDYSGYLNGTAKEELDKVNKLDGCFEIEASKMTLEKFCGGEELPTEEWDFLRHYMRIPFIRLLEGTAEFSIVEQISNRRRHWVLSDVDGRQIYLMVKRCELKPFRGVWLYFNDFFEDGNLTIVRKVFSDDMKLCLSLFNSFTVDSQGNIIRKIIMSDPVLDIKITRVIYGRRET